MRGINSTQYKTLKLEEFSKFPQEVFEKWTSSNQWFQLRKCPTRVASYNKQIVWSIFHFVVNVSELAFLKGGLRAIWNDDVTTPGAFSNVSPFRGEVLPPCWRMEVKAPKVSRGVLGLGHRSSRVVMEKIDVEKTRILYFQDLSRGIYSKPLDQMNGMMMLIPPKSGAKLLKLQWG